MTNKIINIVKTIDDCEDCPYFRWKDYSYNCPGCCSQLDKDLKVLRDNNGDGTFPIPDDCPLENVVGDVK